MNDKKLDMPAFPKAGLDNWKDSNVINEGMTMRDYFAAKAMQTLIGHIQTATDEDKLGEYAYHFADQMLVERAK